MWKINNSLLFHCLFRIVDGLNRYAVGSTSTSSSKSSPWSRIPVRGSKEVSSSVREESFMNLKLLTALREEFVRGLSKEIIKRRSGRRQSLILGLSFNVRN